MDQVARVIGKALDADDAMRFVKCPRVSGDHCNNPMRGCGDTCDKCVEQKVLGARATAARKGQELQSWIHNHEEMLAKAERIDTGSVFFKNCAQHRRRNCASCASCPFRSRVEAAERVAVINKDGGK